MVYSDILANRSQVSVCSGFSANLSFTAVRSEKMFKAVKIYSARKGDEAMRLVNAGLSLVTAAFLGCAFLLSPVVKGDTITLANQSQNTMTGVYTYTVTLTSTAQVGAGNGFVIYDFPAVVLSGTSFSWSAASLATLTLHGDAAANFSPQVSLTGNYVSATSDGGVTPSAPSGPA